MKLLFCIKALNNPGGGAERVLADVASGLAARGHDVTVLSYDAPGGESFYALHDRVRRIELGIGSTTATATVAETLRRMAALRRHARRTGPDVVIGFMHSMFLPLGAALLGTGLPVVASEHIVPAHYRERPLQAALLLTAPLLTRRITTVSPQARDQYPRWLRRTMVPISNPISVSAEGRAEVAGRDGQRKILLTVGRLDPQKDQEVLIRAFAAIAAEVPDWDLRIIGSGPLHDHLAAVAAELGLTPDRVQLPGSVKGIGAEYLRAQLFAMPSRYESFGLTTAEALAHGLPVVGFADCPGTNLLVRPEVDGLLVEAESDRCGAYAEALLRLMTDTEGRCRMAASAGVVPPGPRLDDVLDAWEALFAEVVRR